MSNLLVQNIKHTNNTTAMTVDTAGRIDHPNTTFCDLWRLNADFSSSGATITGWVRPSESYAAYIAPSNTGMSVSSVYLLSQLQVFI